MKRKIQISDHARIRYLQRIKGLDLKKLDAEIIPDGIMKSMQDLGVDSMKYSVGDYRIVIVNNIVKSIVPRKPRYSKRKSNLKAKFNRYDKREIDRSDSASRY